MFDTHFDAIRSFVFYRCGDSDTASDIAQDVFLKIWEKRTSLNANHIKPLLYKMANDCYIDGYRKQMYRVDFVQSLVREEESDASPEEEMQFRETAAAFAAALEEMTEMQRTAFLLSREEGMKYGEIANYLKMSVKTVEKHISAALRLLRTKLL